jgi:hypothetical protein
MQSRTGMELVRSGRHECPSQAGRCSEGPTPTLRELRRRLDVEFFNPTYIYHRKASDVLLPQLRVYHTMLMVKQHGVTVSGAPVDPEH